MRRTVGLGCLVAAVFCSLYVAETCCSADDSQELRRAVVRGSFGTYDGAPRGKDKHVDIPRLLDQLADLRANTYHWLIWKGVDDWGDLAKFLPLARQRGISVWVCLIPPSESPPNSKNFSEPYQLDYERWATEIAKLSVREPNLKAWSIDDFGYNVKILTPNRMAQIVAATRQINPKLAFVPCLYFAKDAANPKFVEKYRDVVDGILFPYRHESVKADLTDASQVCAEIKKIRELWGPSTPVILDVYSHPHSRLGSSTPDYVRQVMTAGKQCADGVHIYCHPNPKAHAEKYGIIKELFHEWATEEDVLY
ncbi:MAG: hypothetical protein ABFC77_14760 [Thermoguttaceae bacterium]